MIESLDRVPSEEDTSVPASAESQSRPWVYVASAVALGALLVVSAALL